VVRGLLNLPMVHHDGSFDLQEVINLLVRRPVQYIVFEVDQGRAYSVIHDHNQIQSCKELLQDFCSALNEHVHDKIEELQTHSLDTVLRMTELSQQVLQQPLPQRGQPQQDTALVAKARHLDLDPDSVVDTVPMCDNTSTQESSSSIARAKQAHADPDGMQKDLDLLRDSSKPTGATSVMRGATKLAEQDISNDTLDSTSSSDHAGMPSHRSDETAQSHTSEKSSKGMVDSKCKEANDVFPDKEPIPWMCMRGHHNHWDRVNCDKCGRGDKPDW